MSVMESVPMQHSVRFYRGGDYCEYTGRGQYLYGRFWYEYRVISRIGSHAGKTLLTPDAPGICSALPCLCDSPHCTEDRPCP